MFDDNEAAKGAMPRLAVPVRKPPRPFSAKVKTGCQRCKTRKVKCPEEKPQCSRCVRMGLSDCQYPLLSQPANPRPRISWPSRQAIPSLALYALARAPSSAYFGPALSALSPVQVTYLDRFRHKMMLRITFLTFNDFWGRVVLHETLADECVLDAVLSLGALDQAWDHDKATRKSLNSGQKKQTGSSLACASSSSCYREAVKHYSRSVQRLHRRLKVVSALTSGSRDHTGDGEPIQTVTEVRQLVPVLTMLYCLFEWLHGDECAHDRLLSNGLSMAMGGGASLSAGINGSAIGCNAQPSRALVGTAGTSGARFFEEPEDATSLLVRWIALSWIQWPAFSTSAAAVARDYDLHAGRGGIDLMSLPPPPATLAKRDYESVGGMVVKLVTLVTLWFMRLRVDGADAAVTAAVAGKEGAMLDRLREEQDRLERWVCEWEAALAGKAAVETDGIGKMLLKEFLFGFETLRFMIQVGVPGAETEARSVLTAHRIMEDIEERVRVSSGLGKVGLGECEPTPLGLIVRECRDMSARARALTVCRWASQARALWDAKGSMIGSCALAALEEQSRDGVTGQVSRASQWRWVHAAWAEGHEVLEVQFRSVVADNGGQFRYRTSRLATVDFGFVPG